MELTDNKCELGKENNRSEAKKTKTNKKQKGNNQPTTIRVDKKHLLHFPDGIGRRQSRFAGVKPTPYYPPYSKDHTAKTKTAISLPSKSFFFAKGYERPRIFSFPCVVVSPIRIVRLSVL